MTRAAPRRAPLRRWEWRLVAPTQGAPHFRTRTARWDPGRPSLATCRSAQSDPKETFVASNRTAGKTYTGHSWPSPSAGSDPSAPLSEAASSCRGRKRLRGLIVPFGVRARRCAEGLRTPRLRGFHGPTSARECRRTSIRRRRRRRSLGQRPVGLPEAGCAPRRP